MRSFTAAAGCVNVISSSLRRSTAALAIAGVTFSIATLAHAAPTTAPTGKHTTTVKAATQPVVKVEAVQASLPLIRTEQVDPNGLNPMEAEFVERVNRERTSRGLNALIVDPMLIQVARGHSEEMCRLNYFDHHSPTAGIVTPMDRFLKALHDSNLTTPPYVLVGENIYYCSVMNDHYNVEFGHNALMNSPGHRANILEPRFSKIGVGTYRDAKGEFWVTETFLRDSEPQTASTK